MKKLSLHEIYNLPKLIPDGPKNAPAWLFWVGFLVMFIGTVVSTGCYVVSGEARFFVLSIVSFIVTYAYFDAIRQVWQGRLDNMTQFK